MYFDFLRLRPFILLILLQGFTAASSAGTNPPRITSDAPYETAATDSSITLSWQSDASGHSVVRFGRTPDLEKGLLVNELDRTGHELTLNGLSPAQIYRVKVGVASGSDTTWSDPRIVSTGSPSDATGEINVYFNGSVFEEAARSETAVANYDFGEHYDHRIRNAKHSVDIMFYNISQDTGEMIKDALIQAARTGVRIRVIMHHDLGTPANNIRQDLRLTNNINVIQSDFGDNNGLPDNRIMHNKIAIIDYQSDDPADTWLITSSWNTTDHGSYRQYQNMIEFQDPALAGGYLTEFNQMWGSDGFEPDAGNARFSRNKKVVNPTRFWIGDAEIDIFFSPQANSEQVITDRLSGARHDVALPKYLITRSTYVDALDDLVQQGLPVRGAIGDISYNTGLFNDLSGIADVHDHGANFGNANDMLLHHKTAIIDAFDPESDNAQVITGSMNWSYNGNFNSDENTIIIRDRRVANLYFQEFVARYDEAGGQADLTITSSENEDYQLPETISLLQNYPNPFNPATRIAFELPQPDEVTLTIYDVTGRRVATLLDGAHKPSGRHETAFDASGLSSGLYIYRLSLLSGSTLSRTMLLIK